MLNFIVNLTRWNFYYIHKIYKSEGEIILDTILTIVKLLGGLGLFIYGMKLMGDGLENAAGEGLKKILEKVTKNPIIGVIVGAVVTMVIQRDRKSVV